MNEADELHSCLLALAGQRPTAVKCVVVCLNNCNDDSASVIDQLAGTLPFPVEVLNLALPPSLASAGMSRRAAMDRAAARAGPDGILLTTDADARVPQDWVAENLSAIGAGADAVAGRAKIETTAGGMVPVNLDAIDASERTYARLLDEIRSLLDPDPFDPLPRHDEHSGASIAVTTAAYLRAGGMPAVSLAEDRAFFEMLRRVDARIRHAPEVRVVVSARLHGRAAGGMADTIRRRLERPDPFLDARLEPARDAVRRARIGGELRRMWQGGAGDTSKLRRIAASLGVTTEWLASHFEIALTETQGSSNPEVRRSYFGDKWARLQHQCPLLQRRLVSLESLPAEIVRARRARDWLRHAADRADTRLPVAAE